MATATGNKNEFMERVEEAVRRDIILRKRVLSFLLGLCGFIAGPLAGQLAVKLWMKAGINFDVCIVPAVLIALGVMVAGLIAIWAAYDKECYRDW